MLKELAQGVGWFVITVLLALLVFFPLVKYVLTPLHEESERVEQECYERYQDTLPPEIAQLHVTLEKQIRDNHRERFIGFLFPYRRGRLPQFSGCTLEKPAPNTEYAWGYRVAPRVVVILHYFEYGKTCFDYCFKLLDAGSPTCREYHITGNRVGVWELQPGDASPVLKREFPYKQAPEELANLIEQLEKGDVDVQNIESTHDSTGNYL